MNTTETRIPDYKMQDVFHNLVALSQNCKELLTTSTNTPEIYGAADAIEGALLDLYWLLKDTQS